jgi:hypothetical protein
MTETPATFTCVEQLTDTLPSWMIDRIKEIVLENKGHDLKTYQEIKALLWREGSMELQDTPNQEFHQWITDWCDAICAARPKCHGDMRNFDTYMDNCRAVETEPKLFAEVAWMASDVQSRRPNWSTEECEAFLAENNSVLAGRMVETGWEVIDCLLPTDGEHNAPGDDEDFNW